MRTRIPSSDDELNEDFFAAWFDLWSTRASETPIVLGVSPWTTPYQLWQQKLGLAANEINQAMLHGTELESAARAVYERLTGLVMQPLVTVDGDYSVSLDEMTLL